VTREELDHLSGLQPGYSTKLLTRTHIKRFGKVSLGPMLGATGCKLLLVEDTEATARIRAQMTPGRGGGRCALKGRTAGGFVEPGQQLPNWPLSLGGA
jgi:hypothetical protein